MNESIVTGLVLLVCFGTLAQLVAWHLRVPSILLLLGVGLIAGPLLGWLEPHEILGNATFPFVSLGAALVLFEGGLTARFQDMSEVRGPVLRLISIGLGVTWIATSWLTHALVGLPWELSILLGAILVVTGPTVVGPILRQAKPHGKLSRILNYEGVINDPIGAIVALLVFQVIQVEQVETALSLVVLGVLRATLVSVALGWAGSWLYVQLRRREWIAQALEHPALLSLVLGVYALAQHIQAESGLLAVTLLGVFLASQKKLDVERSVEFAEELRTLVIASLFLLLTARVEWSDLHALPAEGLVFVLCMIFVVRPLSVFVATARAGLSFREKIFLSAMAPRGVVAAAVASVFAIRLEQAGYEEAKILMPLTFLMITTGVIVYGLTGRPLVRLLRLEEAAPNQVLLLGANSLCRRLGESLAQHGIRATLVDTRRRRVRAARAVGLRAEHGRLESEHVMQRLQLQEMGLFVALTENHDANSLACKHLKSALGPARIYQVECGHDAADPGQGTAPLQGLSFALGQSIEDLLDRARRGRVKSTPLTETFPYEAFRNHYGERAQALFCVTAEGRVRVVAEDDPPRPGEKLISVIDEAAVTESTLDESDEERAPRHSTELEMRSTLHR